MLVPVPLLQPHRVSLLDRCPAATALPPPPPTPVGLQEDETFAQANQTAAEAICNIRTIAAFGMEGQVSQLYATKLEAPTKEATKRSNAAGGCGVGALGPPPPLSLFGGRGGERARAWLGCGRVTRTPACLTFLPLLGKLCLQGSALASPSSSCFACLACPSTMLGSWSGLASAR